MSALDPIDVERWTDGLDDLGLPLTTVPFPGAWRARGECRNFESWMFFPERGDDVRAAKRVCALCTVRVECLEYALDAGPSLAGVWGGKSGRELTALRSARAAAR